MHATELGIKLIPPSEPQFTAKAGFHLPEDRLDNAAVATWAHIWLFLSCCPWTIGVQDSKLSHNGHIKRIFCIRGDHSVTSEESYKRNLPCRTAGSSLRGALKGINHALGSGSSSK